MKVEMRTASSSAPEGWGGMLASEHTCLEEELELFHSVSHVSGCSVSEMIPCDMLGFSHSWKRRILTHRLLKGFVLLKRLPQTVEGLY